MRKVIVFNMISVDGFFAGPHGELDWHIVDEEFSQFAEEQLNEVDTLLFGRVTYEGMLSYWTTPEAIADSPAIADKMNTLPKVVFSKTLDKVEWGQWDNATLVKGDMREAILALKAQSGKDMIIFGSGGIVATLTRLRLIDEYRLMVSPTILGNGQALFDTMEEKLPLKLINTRTFNSGNILLYYQSVQ